jgi:hypothetical protein
MSITPAFAFVSPHAPSCQPLCLPSFTSIFPLVRLFVLLVCSMFLLIHPIFPLFVPCSFLLALEFSLISHSFPHIGPYILSCWLPHSLLSALAFPLNGPRISPRWHRDTRHIRFGATMHDHAVWK